jgi:glutathione synthase/RimK-type ligase-like ATP-grasp enzyme
VKFSIVSKSISNWHVQQLLAACKKFGVDSEVHHLHSPNTIVEDVKKFGDVVLWRASKLDIRSERAVVGEILKDKYVINDAVLQRPYVAYKFVQQMVAEQDKHVPHIATYRFHLLKDLKLAIESKLLHYPFIAKPNYGAQGKGIVLVETDDQLKAIKPIITDMVFQNFIPNDGDWRIIVFDGKPLGVMKRIARKGHYLNNISQGGSSEHETDPVVVQTVSDIAVRMANNIGYKLCGVDVIQDNTTGAFFFLEINSAPEWDGDNGFQAVTGVNVAEVVVQEFKKRFG